MNRRYFLGLGLSLGACLLAVVPAAAEDTKGKNSAVVPAMKDEGRHKQFVEIAGRGGVDVLFLGDSITDAWGGEGHGDGSPGSKAFNRDFRPLKAANFGIGGDRTQHVLWRLQSGELKGIDPKVVMLMIGTNNLGSNSAEEIADGIKAIVEAIHRQKPHTKVLLLGIFPRGREATDPNREKIKDINKVVSKLDDDGKTVKYLDIGKKFLEEDGSISREIMPDYLHLTPKGYEIWAAAVKPTIEQMVKD